MTNKSLVDFKNRPTEQPNSLGDFENRPTVQPNPLGDFENRPTVQPNPLGDFKNRPTVRPLPDGWIWTSLEKCAEILDRQRVPINSRERAERIEGKPETELIPYFGATGQVGWIDEHIFDEELVLLGEDGAPFLDAGKDVAYMIRGKSWVNNHAHVLRAANGLTRNSYLLHYLNTFDFHEYVTGTTRLKLNQSRMKEIPVPIAPSPEQERIVAEIEKQFTRLDQAVASLRRLQSNLARYKASVLKAACDGRLVPQNPNDEPAADLLARILVERRAQWQAANPGKKYQEPVGVEGETAVLPELPDGWVWVSVDVLLREDLSNGRSVKTREGGFPVLRLTAFQDGKIDLNEFKEGDWTAKDADSYFVREGDFFVSRGNGSIKLVGRGGLVKTEPKPVAFPDTMIRLRFSSLINIDYLSAIWNSPLIREQIETSARTTAGIYKINQNDIRNYAIPLPPLAEQERIVAEVERRLSMVTAVEQTITANLSRAERLRQSILHRAFTGQL
jgi:type I restriction enzyme S subunit